MAFQKVVDTVEIGIIYSQNAVIVQNTFYAKMVGGYLLADLVALAASVDAFVQGNWKAQQVTEAIYLRTEVRGLAVENDLVTSNSDSTGPGVLVSPPLPNNVTLSIKKESGLTGRSARGRTYWIGVPQDRLLTANENLLEAAYVVDVVAAIDQIRGAINSVGTWQAVLVSRFTAGAPRSEGVTFPWITTSNVDTRIDTLRGRLPD